MTSKYSLKLTCLEVIGLRLVIYKKWHWLGKFASFYFLFFKITLIFLVTFEATILGPLRKCFVEKLHLKGSIKSNSWNLVLFRKLTAQFMKFLLSVIDDTRYVCTWNNPKTLQILSTLSIKDNNHTWFTSSKGTVNTYDYSTMIPEYQDCEKSIKCFPNLGQTKTAIFFDVF